MMSGMEHVGKQARPKRTRKRGYIGQKYDLKKSALATSFQGMENERKAENSRSVQQRSYNGLSGDAIESSSFSVITIQMRFYFVIALATDTEVFSSGTLLFLPR